MCYKKLKAKLFIKTMGVKIKEQNVFQQFSNAHLISLKNGS